MLAKKQVPTFSIALLIIVLTPQKVNLLEYGFECTPGSQCIAEDFRDPLVCNPPATPTPTTTTIEPSSTTEPPSEPTTATTTTELSTTPTETEPSSTTETITTTDEPTDATTTESPEPPPDSMSEDDFEWSGMNDSIDTWYEFKRKVAFQEDEMGTCGCVPGTFRHENLNRCVSPPSGDCDLKVSDGSPMRTCTKFAGCFPKTNNSTDGTCYCDTDAIENSNTGHCVLNHGSKRCENRGDCEVHNLLTCRNGTCVCEYEDIQKWNPISKKCGFVVGESCTNNDTPYYPNPGCVENAECTNDICQCKGGFKETPEKECKLPFNETCEAHSDCHPYFTCSNNTCICGDGLLYFESTERCHLPEGSQCDDASSTDFCTLGSQCVNETCVCDEGYESSINHTCQALYGSQCSAEIACHEDSYLNTCGESRICNCKPNYKYHPASQRCVGNIEEACREDLDCIDHAICSSGDNKCICGGSYMPGADKASCFTRYGDRCDILDCFSGHFLKCDENRMCTCMNPEDQIYDDIRGYCVAKAGRLCYGSGNGIECVQFSVCDAQPDGVTKCSCDQGYLANSTGYCVQVVSSSIKISGFHGLITFVIILLTTAKGSFL